MVERTSIQILESQKERIKELKIAQEPYYIVIEKLLDFYEKEKDD